MTSLDSILKSRDITLPTKVHLVKAMVFSLNCALSSAVVAFTLVKSYTKLEALARMLGMCWGTHWVAGGQKKPARGLKFQSASFTLFWE